MLADGQPLTLATAGMWQVTFRAFGAVDALTRTYWVDVPAVTVSITAPDEPFPDSLLVMAGTSDAAARLFHSLDGIVWTEGATVTITEDAAVSFLAIKPDGIASTVTTRSFTKRPWQATVTASATDHFLAGRIDATEYVTLTGRFGSFTPFALFLVAGEWVLDPGHPAALTTPLPPAEATETAPTAAPPLIRVRPADPHPGGTQARSPWSSKPPTRRDRSPFTTAVTAPCPIADPPGSTAPPRSSWGRTATMPSPVTPSTTPAASTTRSSRTPSPDDDPTPTPTAKRRLPNQQIRRNRPNFIFIS